MSYIQQDDRHLYLDTPVGENLLLLNHFTGHEAFQPVILFPSCPAGDAGHKVAFEKLIGQHVSFGILGGFLGLDTRDFDGIAIHVAQGEL